MLSMVELMYVGFLEILVIHLDGRNKLATP